MASVLYETLLDEQLNVIPLKPIVMLNLCYYCDE